MWKNNWPVPIARRRARQDLNSSGGQAKDRGEEDAGGDQQRAPKLKKSKEFDSKDYSRLIYDLHISFPQNIK